MKPKSTSWDNVASWYQNLLKYGRGTYQHDVILPNILRLLAPKAGQKILDIGCGPGFFARAFAQAGADVAGVDISEELIAFAKQEVPQAKFFVCSADNITPVTDGTNDAATIILSLQNIENITGVFAQCRRVLKSGGRLLIVLNHPAFRVPKQSSWEFDEKNNAQYRRLDSYLSEARAKIDMHPGLSAVAGAKADDDHGIHTWSFHRPLQVYFKLLHKHGFAVMRLEEWIGNRAGPRGQRFAASERARKEFPLFLFLEAKLL